MTRHQSIPRGLMTATAFVAIIPPFPSAVPCAMNQTSTPIQSAQRTIRLRDGEIELN